MIEEELFNTSWGTNLTWEPTPEDGAFVVHVRSNIVEHRLEG